VQAATPAVKGNVFEQTRYEARSQSLPFIDEEERHPLYFDRDHACIVMATTTPRIDRMESVSTAQAAIISAFIKVLL